jgi:uncharacterized iron-regulated membrane protein
LPLLVLVMAGILLCFDDDIAAALNVGRPAPLALAVPIELTPAQAMRTGLARFPGATLTALSMPSEESPLYRVQLHAPGEVWRMYGQTTVFLSAKDGTILQEYAAASAPPIRLALDWLYPLHTGEFGGVVARALLLLIGLTLLTLGSFAFGICGVNPPSCRACWRRIRHVRLTHSHFPSRRCEPEPPVALPRKAHRR